jgi:hypothetical protein
VYPSFLIVVQEFQGSSVGPIDHYSVNTHNIPNLIATPQPRKLMSESILVLGVVLQEATSENYLRLVQAATTLRPFSSLSSILKL